MAGLIAGLAVTSLRIVCFDPHIRAGDLLTPAVTIVLAFVVYIRWRGQQFAHESGKQLLIDLTKEVRRTLNEIRTDAEELALQSFNQVVRRFKSVSSGVTEIQALAKEMLHVPESNDLNSKVVQLKRIVTGKGASNPLTPADLVDIES